MLRPPPVPEEVLSSARQRMIRGRLHQAAAEVAAVRGVHRVSIGAITAQAGLTAEAFREHYANVEDCLTAAFQDALDRAATRVIPSYQESKQWPEAISSGLLALLQFADEQPALARLLFVEGQYAFTPIRRRRAEAIRLLVRAVDDGRTLSSHPQSLRPMTAEAIVGGLIGVIGERLQNGSRGSMSSLHARLTSVILLAYQGTEQARDALRRKPAATPATQKPAKQARRGSAVAPASETQADTARRNGSRDDPGGKLVLTARTAMVLQVIAEHPGATNRQVQIAAGIATGGDASKLLARLQRHGVIENTGAPGRGGRNAWHLTEKGAWAGQAARA